MNRRGSGILLHITCLPSRFGIGDLGPPAYKFADFLSETRQIYWQVLPMNPTSTINGNSPYTSSSAFAGNKLLISPELLRESGLLSRSDLKDCPNFPEDHVEYAGVTEHKEKLLARAYEKFSKTGSQHQFGYAKFCDENSHWLDDYALFEATKAHFHDAAWSDWPVEVRDRQPEALQKLRNELAQQVEFEKFCQYLFFTHLKKLRQYCNDLGIQIIGDIPYYVSYDSADVWTNPQLFKLDEDRRPAFMAGVPPDYFSETGQLWGNPVYRWEVLDADDYHWWIQRMKQNFLLFDIVRIDHFRGFVGYWEVPAGETTAINGQWVDAPAERFFNTLLKHIPNLPIIAEDLGVITPDVGQIIQKLGIPGMRVLLFAFDESLPHNAFAPHNHVPNCIVYTGTHDNNTILGWFREEVDEAMKKRISKYLGREVTAENVVWEIIRLAFMSVANVVLVPMQDFLGLGNKARMNRPAISDNNWQWRVLPEQVSPALAERLRNLTEIFGRA
jgi:4-alpha-glucanotransferase